MLFSQGVNTHGLWEWHSVPSCLGLLAHIYAKPRRNLIPTGLCLTDHVSQFN